MAIVSNSVARGGLRSLLVAVSFRVSAWTQHRSPSSAGDGGGRSGVSQSLGRVSLVLGLPLALVGCSVAAPEPLRIGSNLWPGYETLYLARHLDYYKGNKIRLVDYPSGTEEVRAYRNGEIDGAGLSIDQAIVLASTQKNIRIIAVMDFSDGGDVILGRPDIPNVKALRGKRIGVESTALGAFFLTRALEKNGMAPKDVEIVSLELSDHDKAFRAGEVDAVVTFGPPRVSLLASGARLLFDSSAIPGEIVDTLAVSTEAIARNPKAVQALVDGRFRALDYFQLHPEKAATVMAKRTKVTPAELLDAFKGLKQPSLAENQALLSNNDPTLVRSMTKLVDVMLKNRLLEGNVDPATLLDDQFVKEAMRHNKNAASR